MTNIPMPEHTIGGVHEMERYLHAVMVAYGMWAHIGQGTEWFAVPCDLLTNPDKCPELMQVIADAPAWDEVTCFQRLGHNTNTTKRTAAEKRKDRAGRTLSNSTGWAVLWGLLMPLRCAKRFQKSMTPLTYKSIQTTDKYIWKLVFQNLEF